MSEFDRQRWDDIVKAGWGPGFAAGTILNCLRSHRDVEEWQASLYAEAVARWYYRQLVEHGSLEPAGPWTRALTELWEWITPDEHTLLRK